MKFWDSSALIPLLVEEVASEKIRSVLKADPSVISWWGTPIECFSALCRRKREGLLAEDQLQRTRERLGQLSSEIDWVLASEAIRDRAMRLLATHSLRTGDALQLAAALRWCQDETKGMAFVCLDERLKSAAIAEGFAVLPLPVETYSRERKAEFLLSNAVDKRDYSQAVEEVRKMGLDPAKIPHHKIKG